MKELSIEQKAQRYDEAIAIAREINNEQRAQPFNVMTRVFPELKESEGERIRKHLIGVVELYYGNTDEQEKKDCLAWLEKQAKKDEEILILKDKIESLHAAIIAIKETHKIGLEKQGGQNLDTDFSDLRTWKYIVDAVWTEKEGIGQYLDSPFTEEVAKKLQKRFGNIEQILANSAKTCKDEQKPAKWHREDEQNLNACLGYIPDEFLRKWLTDIIHVKYDKSVELPKGEDYGIDGLYAAVDILKKTLGKVDGYQSDDGILEHKCAITAVKKLYEKKPTEWSEEDKNRINRLIAYFEDKESFTAEDDIVYANWLKSLKDRYTWKPSGEQMKYLHKYAEQNNYDGAILTGLYNDLKQLKQL